MNKEENKVIRNANLHLYCVVYFHDTKVFVTVLLSEIASFTINPRKPEEGIFQPEYSFTTNEDHNMNVLKN